MTSINSSRSAYLWVAGAQACGGGSQLPSAGLCIAFSGILYLDTLPGEPSTEEVQKDISYSLEVVPTALLYKVMVSRHST